MEEKIMVLEDILDVREGSLNEDTELGNLEEWDSFAKLSIMAAAKKRKGLMIGAEQLMNCKTVGDLLLFL